MSETESKWPLPFARQFFVDAMGGVWKGAKRLPSHGLQQAIKDMVGGRLADPQALASLSSIAVQEGTLVPWVLPPEEVAGDGKPSTLIDRERMQAALNREVQRAKWESSRMAARANRKSPPPEPRPPVTRSKMIPSVAPYPAHGDLGSGWVVLELEDRIRVLLHGPSVAALAPDFSAWQ